VTLALAHSLLQCPARARRHRHWRDRPEAQRVCGARAPVILCALGVGTIPPRRTSRDSRSRAEKAFPRRVGGSRGDGRSTHGCKERPRWPCHLRAL